MNKRLRFAVLTRDKFTCQYCGRKAPDVTLEVDHIHARAHGGQDDSLNLLTACTDCNRGKATQAVSIDPPTLVEYKRPPRITKINVNLKWRSPYRGDPRFKLLLAYNICCYVGCIVRMVDLVEGPDGRMYCTEHAYQALVREGHITIHPDPAGADDTLEEASRQASNRAWTPTGKPLRKVLGATS